MTAFNDATQAPITAQEALCDYFPVSSFTQKMHDISKQAAYHGSLAYTLINQYIHSGTYQWWNPIKDSNIVLGAIPLKNKDHHIQILKLATDAKTNLAVLTLLEQFEIESSSYFAEPVKQEDWKKLGVTHKVISAGDFLPLTQQQIKDSIQFLEEQDAKGTTTYVHCKAGRGRSATAVVCYIMKKHKISAELAKERVLESRCQINLNSHQWQAIKDYEASLTECH